jgi:hypothetical protein
VLLQIILYVAALWCGACDLHALQTVEQSFYLPFLNDNLVFNIYQPNVFKELAHLVGGQGLGKAVSDYIISNVPNGLAGHTGWRDTFAKPLPKPPLFWRKTAHFSPV